MNNSKLAIQSFLFSIGVVLYISLVAAIMNHGKTLFGKMDNFWGPIAFLMLFCVSAAITGLLVFGRPIYLFLNGHKTECVKQALYTVSFLFLETILFLLGIAIF